MAPHVVVEVGVAAVDDRVARLEVLEQLGDLGLGRVARRDHDPDGTGCLERRDQLGDRERPDGALAGDLAGLLRRPVVGDHLVPVADQAADHVGAHPPEPDEPDAHGVSPPCCVEGRGQRPLERREPGVRIGAEVDPQDRQVVRLDRGEVARRLGVDELAEGVGPARDRHVGRVVGGQLEEPADWRRRPCAAGRSNGGSAGRSRRSSPARSGRAAGHGSGRRPRRAPGVGAMNAWRHEVAHSGADGRGAAPARRRRRRRRSVRRSAASPWRARPSAVAIGSAAGAGRPRLGRARHGPHARAASRVRCLASSTLGWSNGSMPEDRAGDRGRRPPSGRTRRRGRSGPRARC